MRQRSQVTTSKPATSAPPPDSPVAAPSEPAAGRRRASAKQGEDEPTELPPSGPETARAGRRGPSAAEAPAAEPRRSPSAEEIAERSAIAREFIDLAGTEIPNAYSQVVTSIFSIGDPPTVCRSVEEALRPIRPSHCDRGVLIDSLDAAQENARLARQLYLNAKVTAVNYEASSSAVVGAMRSAALAAIQQEKDSGVRTKQITKDDVENEVAIRFPDEWQEVQKRKAQVKALVDYLETLCERTVDRARDLRALVSAAS